MKILQVNKLYAPHIGGIEKVVQDIAEGLNDRLDIRTLVCQAKGKASNEIYNGVKLTRVKSWGIFFSMPVSFDFFKRFREMSKEADVILLHTPFPLSDIAVWLFRPKCKIIIWWHSDIIKQKIFRRLLSPFINFNLRRANSIITATEGHIKSSMYLKNYTDKCTVIPYGLDFSKYPIPSESDYLTKKLRNKTNFKLLFVGRLVYYKGIDVLLRAMENVSEAELFIVGSGPLSGKIPSGIHVLGSVPQEELLSAYADCDIFIFPSVANSEAFGLVQLEAMYYGKPVINTHLPTGVPNVSIHGETGLTVKPGDSAQLANAINDLIHDKEKRKRFGENAYKRVREK